MEKGVFSQGDLAVYQKMIGFRNVVGHDYLRLDKKIVHSILTEGRKDSKRIAGKIVQRFL